MLADKSFKAQNISCGHCAGRIERGLGELDGVVSVSVDVATKVVTVQWNEPPASWEAICSVLQDIDHPPKEEECGESSGRDDQ